MRKQTEEEIKQKGRMILIYSETGVGKTTSILQTVPDPLCYIQAEPRSLEPSLKAANRPNLDFDAYVYETATEAIKFLSNSKNFKRYKTVALDGLTHLLNILLPEELVNENVESKKADNISIATPLADEVEYSQRLRGLAHRWMFRICNAFMKIARDGKIVIITCLLTENPRYDRALSAAPNLAGREVPLTIPGYFDLIGLLQTRVDENGNVIYPPWIKFESPKGDFVAKFTGMRKPGTVAEGILDFSKIIS